MDRERMQWGGKLEYLFTSFGYTVGLGNIWRFPYKCYIHGGGAFFIPYVLTVVLCSFPILFLEMFMGQFSSEGPITVWKFCPIFKGVGWAIIFNIFMTNINYIVIVMYSFYYMLVSLVNIGGTLPWQQCQKPWATQNCRNEPFPNYDEISYDSKKIGILQNYLDVSCMQKIKNMQNITVDPVLFGDFRALYKSCEKMYKSPEEEYWNRFVLGVHKSDGLDDLGPVVGRNAIILLLVWLMVFYCCVKGIRSLAKVAYFTASFPFLVLLILLVRGMTLEGHEIGIKYYTEPDYRKLSNMAIWSSAATQAMYSIGVAFGSHIALASHNRFSNNVLRDGIILGCVNTLTSVCGGFVVFAFLGHASYTLNRPIDTIFDQGPGLIFISYLQGISQLPGSAMWAFLFFMVVLTLGVDSVFIMVWTVYVSIEDVFPDLFKKKGNIILIAMCVVPYLLGLPLITDGGIHLLVVMDRYTADFTLTLFLIMESVAVCWVYGLRRFIADVEMMIGRKSVLFKWYWMATWGVTAPAFGMFIFIASAVGYTSVSYNGITTTPGGEAFGWILILTPLVIMLGVAGYQIRKYGGIKEATFEEKDWGPRLKVNRSGRYVNEYIHPIGQRHRMDSDRCESSFATPTCYSAQDQLADVNINGGYLTCDLGGSRDVTINPEVNVNPDYFTFTEM
ncbi:sodium-dependent proline transporter-like [Ruditapes philippinarum]|uniref:sodium-dependent proline transporter-like n=1 Tax=Ruditapes philippinarum TaxID=129788 RepID=UPI00295BF347|nr:sodium-dependent proline transporter-like [Ruditapes philippinarum]